MQDIYTQYIYVGYLCIIHFYLQANKLPLK